MLDLEETLFVVQCLDFRKRPLNHRIFGGRLLKVPVLFVFKSDIPIGFDRFTRCSVK